MHQVCNIRLSNVHVLCQKWGESFRALVDINLEIFSGQWVVILGPNGSGKSTLLNVISGIQSLSSGQIEFYCQQNNTHGYNFDSYIFHVRQDPLLGTADNLTLMENLIVADPCFYNRQSRDTTYRHLLSKFDLEKRANQLVRFLSGGERQIVALLIAKIRNPAILLLDEAFAALHPSAIQRCTKLLLSMFEHGTTILQVTHTQQQFIQVRHRNITLEQGAIIHDTFNDINI